MTPIGGKSITEMSIDTDIDHVSSYGQIVWHVLNLTAYCCSGRAVFNCILIMEGEQEMVI